MRAQLGALLAMCAALQALAGTGITVTNNYKKEVNGEHQGATSMNAVRCVSNTRVTRRLFRVCFRPLRDLTVKIQGTGVGGCDIVIQPGETNQSDCWCLWGYALRALCACWICVRCALGCGRYVLTTALAFVVVFAFASSARSTTRSAATCLARSSSWTATTTARRQCSRASALS